MSPRPQWYADPVSLAAAIIAGIAVGIFFGWVVHGSESSSAQPGAATQPARAGDREGGRSSAQSEDRDEPEKVARSEKDSPTAILRRALKSSVSAVDVSQGRVELAVVLSGRQDPIVRGSRPGERLRVWSMIKPVTIAALRDRGAFGDYIDAALVRSENCAQRELVLRLTEQAKGTDNALAEIAGVLKAAGARFDRSEVQMSTEQIQRECSSQPGAPWALPAERATSRALLLGTTTWKVADAARFIAAVRRGAYDASDLLLEKLRQPKDRSREPGAQDEKIADPQWGSGKVFEKDCWNLAYKAGWGRKESGEFTAGQMGVVDLGKRRWAAFAVYFHPANDPPTASPDKAGAPEAMAKALDPLRRGLQKAYPEACR